jgi:hypothetical protein
LPLSTSKKRGRRLRHVADGFPRGSIGSWLATIYTLSNSLFSLLLPLACWLVTLLPCCPGVERQKERTTTKGSTQDYICP